MKNVLLKISLIIFLCSGIAAQNKTTEVGVSLIKYFEGLRTQSYRCSANVLTIGVGHTGSDVFENQVITKAEAIRLLKNDLRRFEFYVDKLSNRSITWHEFDALVSFSFNVGYRIDNVMKEAINRGATKLVVTKIMLYNKAKINGSLVILPGLMKRRKAETALYADKWFPLKMN